jgi:predicted amidophosphoribosyltransferase
MKARLICAWCGEQIGWTETPSGEPSHGLCPDCARPLYAEIEERARRRQKGETNVSEGLTTPPVAVAAQ